MLVVDRVELPLLHQSQEVREFHGQNPVRGQQNFHARDEVVQIRDMGEDVVAGQEIRPDAFRHQLPGIGLAEELHSGGDALLLRRRGDVGRRLDTEDRDPRFFEILEKVAVVARQLYHQGVGSQVQPFDHGEGA